MSDKQISEIEMIEVVLKGLYNNGDPKEINLYDFIKEAGWEFKNKRDLERFIEGCQGTTWIYFNERNGKAGFTDVGLLEYEGHGSYNEYLATSREDIIRKGQKIKKKKKIKKFEFIIKNTSSIVAILLSLSTVVVSIISIFDKQELRSLEQEVKQLRTVQDTLIQKLNLSQMPSSTLPIKKDSMP